MKFIDTEYAVGVFSQFVLGQRFVSYKIKKRVNDVGMLIEELSKSVQVPPVHHDFWHLYSYVSLAEMAAMIGMQPTDDGGAREQLGLLDVTTTNHFLVPYRQDIVDLPNHVHYAVNYYNCGYAIINNNHDHGGYPLYVGDRFVCGWGRF